MNRCIFTSMNTESNNLKIETNYFLDQSFEYSVKTFKTFTELNKEDYV